MGKAYLAGSLALVIVVAACAPGGTSSPAGDGEGSAPAAEKRAAPGGAAPAVGPATTVKVTVAGGPRAGSYSASSTETICSLGIIKPGVWGVAYTDANVQAARPEAFTSFGFVGGEDQADGVRDSEDFTAHVFFGPVIGQGSIQYLIKPADELGRGTATVEVRGGSATVTVKGETKDGVKIDARVDCHAIFRLPR